MSSNFDGVTDIVVIKMLGDETYLEGSSSKGTSWTFGKNRKIQ